MIELTFLKELILIRQSESKECDTCHYRYFLDKGFRFQPYVCNRCHYFLKMSLSLSDIAILNIKGTDYCCIINGISKSEAINLIQNIYSTEKSGTL